MIHLVKAAMPVLGLVLAAAVLVGLVLVGLGPAADSTKQQRLVSSSTPDPASRTAIPPLDAAAPARTETATFALG